MNDNPTTEASVNEPLDDSIRTMLRTAVSEAPPAPRVGAISDLSWNAVSRRAHKPRPAVRVGIGIAAAVAFVAGLAVTANHARGRRPGSLATASTTDVRLPSHVLPSTVPDGWMLADVIEGSDVGVVSRPAIQLFRRASGSIQIFIEPLADQSAVPAPTSAVSIVGEATTATTSANAVIGSGSADRATASFENSTAAFKERLARVRVDSSGVSDADAATFVRQLTASGTGAELRYASPDAGWQLEATSTYEPPHQADGAFGVLAYRTAPELSSLQSAFSITLIPSPPADRVWRIGEALERDGVTLYVGDRNAGRQIGDLLASVNFDPASPFAARQKEAALVTLAALAPVDGGAFDVAADQVAAHYTAQPATTTVRVGDVTAIRHTMGSDEAACATGKRGTVRCHRPQALNNGSDNAPVNFDVDFLVDGTWVHVGAVDFPATTVTATEGSLGPDTAAAASPSSRTGVTGWTSTPYGVMYVAVAPSGSRSMAVEAKWSEGSTGAEAHRPHI